MDEKKIDPNVGPLSGKPPHEKPLGPRRRAPRFYAGEQFRGRRINYPDVERYGNGVVPGIRDKAARRVIRKALKRRYSRVEKALSLPRAMLGQAREIAHAEGKSMRWAHRLYARELALHGVIPGGPTRAERRAHKRKLRKLNRADAITQLVDRMTKT